MNSSTDARAAGPHRDLRRERLLQAVRSTLADPAGGPARRESLAATVDDWLAEVWRDARPPPTGVALVAVGSHARRDAGPASDLDLVLLHDGKTLGKDAVPALAERVWYPVWDSGLRLDHSVRSVDACREVSRNDLAAALGLLDLRVVAGDATLGLRAREVLREQWRSGARSRLDEIAASLAERSRLHGELAYLLEGDLKEARGGLRDVVVLHALVASWLADSPHGEIDHATTTLLDVRDVLHAVTGRAGERLLLAEQDAVAVALGVPDADALLTKVASAARTVSHSLDLTLRRARGATTRRRGLRRQKPRLRPLEAGLVEHEGEVVLSSAAAPVSDPTIAVRAAAAAAVHRLPLSPVTASHLASTSVPLPTPWPAQATEALVRLLGAGEPLVGVWETLDQAGLVTTWFPEWAGVRNRPQRTAVHRHTVDRHLVQTCVEATALLDRVSRPDLLLVCALLHDIGKLPGAMDHSSVGAPVAHRVATRLGLSAADAGVVERMVREHLTLVELATRRDPDDPRTVDALVAAVDGREDLLDLLRALTEADARAAGPAAWTPWRRRLVDDLVDRARADLHGAEPTGPSPLTADEEELVRAVHADREPRVEVSVLDGVQTVTLVAPDRPGLFADAAGLLASQGLGVRSALVRTVDGVAVDTWSVHASNAVADAGVLRTGLVRLAGGDLAVLDRLARREAAWRPGRASVDPAGPRVVVLSGASADATVLEVRAVDRPGLLHALGATLRDLRVDVRSAHVATHGGRAVDVLYLTEAGSEVGQGRLSAARTGAVVGALMAAASWEPQG